MTIVGPDVREGDMNDEWTHRDTIPLIIRTLQVPKSFGVNKCCNNTAEIMAIAIAIMSIPFDRENIILTDSEVAIDLFDNIQ
jgi:hypothetical protein